MFYHIDINYIWFHTGILKNVLSCIIARIRGNVYKVLGINSAILLHLYGYDAKSKILIIFFLKFIMLTDNNQIFRNWFVIIHCHLTKVSAQIIQCIVFERNELSITLSTLWYNYRVYTTLLYYILTSAATLLFCRAPIINCSC